MPETISEHFSARAAKPGEPVDPPRLAASAMPRSTDSVAHLDDDERALVLGVVLEQFLAWVRTLSGTQELRALLVLDEVYGFAPPHPANPPTKRPILSLMKQARAFGVGVLVANQNPMDLDYRVLSNAGLWCIGRLQTDADRARVVDALATTDVAAAGSTPADLAAVLKALAPRWFRRSLRRRVLSRWAADTAGGVASGREANRAPRARHHR